jgi:maleamate amidohydrolase
MPFLDLFPNIPDADKNTLLRFWGTSEPPKPRLGKRPALVIVDMTQGIAAADYSAGVAAQVTACVHANARILATARSLKWPVFFSTTQCFPSPTELGGWRREGIPGAFRMLSQRGRIHDVIETLAPREDEVVFAKPKASAFFGTQLASMLNALTVDSLVVTGMMTSGCVRATVNDATALNYPVIVLADALADQFQLSHEVELFDMAARYADVVHTDTLIEQAAPREVRMAA